MDLGQQQTVETLKLVVYRRPLHPELFDIHHRHPIDQSAFDAEIWITGCSHLVRFSVGSESVTEVIAQAHDELPQRGLVASFRCRGERQHEYMHEDMIRYMMSFQVEPMSERLFAKTHSDLFSAAQKQGILVPFPQWQTTEHVPFCHVDYHVTPNSLHALAYHVFPAETTVIKTQTLFELS